MRATAKSASAPRACGSNARAAARSSGRKRSMRTNRSAPSASITSAWTRGRGWPLLFDDGAYEEHDAGLSSTDPLSFVDSKKYTDRLASMQEATSLSDALISAAGTLDGRPREHLRDGAEVHRRQHGRGGGRKNHARDRALHRATHAAGDRLRLGRRAHAGRRDQPDAARQNFGRADASGSKRAFLTSAC